MPAPFHDILVNALTPITLISGVGMVMLCMTNRYSHSTDRIRQLVKKRTPYGFKIEPDIDAEIRLIFRRASFLRRAMLCLALSAACSGLLVGTNVLAVYLQADLSTLASCFLVGALGLIVLATVFFAREVSLSLHALGLAVRHMPRKYPKKEASK